MIPASVDSQNTPLMHEVKAISKLASGEEYRFTFKPISRMNFAESMIVMTIIDVLQAVEIIETVDPLHPGFTAGKLMLRRR